MALTAAPSFFDTQREIFPVGKTLADGKYVLDGLVGVGGMGSVYAAIHSPVGRRVAIKVLHSEFAENETLKRRFEREMRTLARLSSPHCVGIFDCGISEDGALYYVMEYLEGDSLGERLSHGPLTESEFTAIFIQICAGVEAAHALGIVHRDLKPENIFIENTGTTPRVKILDFGIAGFVSDHRFDDENTLSMAGQLIGTPLYMSPEQAMAQAADERSDIYALGLIAYECLTGKLANEGAGGNALMHAAMGKAAENVKTDLGEFPDCIISLIENMLKTSPVQRIQNVSTIRETLEAQQLRRSLENVEELDDDPDLSEETQYITLASRNQAGVGAKFEEVRQEDFSEFLKTVTSWMCIPLFLAFWMADLIYAPSQRWLFLFLRLGVVGFAIGAHWFCMQQRSTRQLETLALAFLATNAWVITAMIALTEKGASPYYAGLNLVGIAGISFLPWSRRGARLCVIGIYGPYVTLSILVWKTTDLQALVLNMFFVVSTIVVSIFVHSFSHRTRLARAELAYALELEHARPR